MMRAGCISDRATGDRTDHATDHGAADRTARNAADHGARRATDASAFGDTGITRIGACAERESDSHKNNHRFHRIRPFLLVDEVSKRRFNARDETLKRT
jgi:hypothetical protein